MTKILFIYLLLSINPSFGQTNNPVAVYDFVRIKQGRTAEALYFYENNWKYYRDIAIGKNIITGYRIVSNKPDSLASYDLILITEYADSIAYAKSEERFSQIIKETRPNGPLLLNGLAPQDFRENLYHRRMETIFSPDK